LESSLLCVIAFSQGGWAAAVHFVPAFWIARSPGAVPELKYQYS